MKKMRITALILSLSMILSLYSFQIASANEFNEPYQKEIDFLTIMEMVENDYDATLVITKSEIAMMVLKVLYPGTDFSKNTESEAFFKDVPFDHVNYPYIKACRDLGIIKGDGNSNFYPNNQITLAEAITMIINALGYSHHAEAFGGYPTGYYTVATKIGLLKNIKLSMTDIVNGGDAVRLIYNSLFTNVVEMTSIENGSVELKINSNVTILNSKFSVYEYNGTVIDNGISSVEGNSIGSADRAVIKDSKTGGLIKAYINGTNVSEYLGYKVKAYIKNNEEEGRYEFVYVVPHAGVTVTTVNAKDIIFASETYVEYDEDEETPDFEKIDLTSNKAVIFNGVQIIGKTLSDIMPKDGFVKFIDNESDNVIDVISIFSMNYENGNFKANARNIVVDNVITEKDKEGIACMFNPSAGIDLFNEEYIYSFVLSSGFGSLADIKNGMVVSVFEAPEKVNGKTYYQLAVYNQSVDGALDVIEGNDVVYFNDGTSYKISSSFTGVKPNYMKGMKNGTNVSLSLDITGKAAYIKAETESTKDYAYIVRAVAKNQGNDYVLIKFFSKDGKMYTLPLSDKATVDGIRVTNMSTNDIVTLIGTRAATSATILNGATPTGRPAIVKVSKEQVISIDTDTPNANLSSGNISKTYEQQSIVQYYEEDAESYDTLKAAFRSPRAVTVSGTNKTVGGKYFITSNTVVMNVPEIDTYGLKTYMSDYRPYGYEGPYLRGNEFQPSLDMIKYYEKENIDENYKIMSLSQMYSTYSFDLQAYDIDPDTGIAGLVVVRGRTDMYRPSNVPAATPMSVFLKTTVAYDEALEKTVTKVHYYENGEVKSATIDLDTCYYPYKALINGCAASDTPHNATVAALSNGDIIRVIQSAGKITHIERVRELDDYKNDLVYGFVAFSRGVTVPYATSVSGARSNFPFNTPMDDEPEDNAYSFSTSNAIGTLYAMKIKGNVIQVAGTKKYGMKFSSIDFNDWKSYSGLYTTTDKLDITVVTVPEDGGEVVLKKGTVDDIVTLEDVGYDTSKASVIMTKMSSLAPTETFVLNGLNNLR